MRQRGIDIDILAMVPEWVFSDYMGGDMLTFELYDSAAPNDAHWVGLRDELEQRKAWMTFGFTHVIPEGGIQSKQYRDPLGLQGTPHDWLQ